MILKRVVAKFNNKEAKNASWIIIGKVVQMVIQLVVSIMTTRYLGPSNYGTITYVAAYTTLFTSLCTLGINFVIVKEFVDNPDEQGMTIGTTLVLRIISSALSACMIVGIVSIIDRNEPITISVAILCSISLVFSVCDTFNYWFQSRYQSRVTSIATLVAYIATAIYKVVLLIIGKDVRWFAFASSVDFIVLAAILYSVYKKYGGPQLSFSLNKAKYLLSKSYHYILSVMMVAIYGQTDKLMLKQMLDQSQVGYYSVATTICTMWVFILQAIIDSIYPTIMRLNSEKDTIAFEKKNRQLYCIVFYLSVVCSSGICVLAPLIVKILYGDAFLPAVNPLRIVTWYTAFAYIGVARNAWIVCNDKQKFLKYLYLISAVLNVVMNYFLIPSYGPEGAAVATLITQLVSTIIVPFFIKELKPNARMICDAIVFKGVK